MGLWSSTEVLFISGLEDGRKDDRWGEAYSKSWLFRQNANLFCPVFYYISNRNMTPLGSISQMVLFVHEHSHTSPQRTANQQKLDLRRQKSSLTFWLFAPPGFEKLIILFLLLIMTSHRGVGGLIKKSAIMSCYSMSSLCSLGN